MSFESDLKKQLDKIQKEIQKKVNGPVNIGELFNNSFMERNTNSKSIDDFFKEGSFEVETEEDLDNIDVGKLNQHVISSTKFSSWEDMKNLAGKEYALKKLK